MKQKLGVTVAATLTVALTCVGCSSSASPKRQLLDEMHKSVPNVPSAYIVNDADEVCAHSQSVARRNLLTDAMAEEANVDGLKIGSTALARYTSKLIKTVRDVNYC